MGRPAANTGLEGAAVKQRNDWLDLWRSLAVLTMLVFHALWDLEAFGTLPKGTMETPLADVIRYLGGGSFVLISGMLAPRSRDPLKRGFRVLCIGLAVAVVTALIGMPVKFGILQLIGLCMMDTMRCHTHTKAGIYVFSILILVTAVFDLVISINKIRKQ